MATKIRLKRQGKKFYAFYRVVIVDSRKKRDGKVIEEIGIYNPNTQPSTIQIKSDRAQYWLGVGAQPSEPVAHLLKITGDWQKFKGLPGAEGSLEVAPEKPSKLDLFNAALAEANEAPTAEAITEKKRKEREDKKAAEAAAKAEAEKEAEAEADAEIAAEEASE